jgi:integrase
VPKKGSTLTTDKGRIERHVKPLLGLLKVASISREDIRKFMNDVAEGKTATKTKTTKKHGLANVRGGKGTASRTMALLGAIFTFAVEKRMRTDNPVRGVKRYADGERNRRLTETEYAAFGDALRQARTKALWPPAIAAIRFLALTGWRRGEALALRWRDVDLVRRTALLTDTKPGRSSRPLSNASRDLLRQMDRIGDLVFAASRGEGMIAGFPKVWARIAKLGALPGDVTPHVLRHSFTSLAADLGYSEPTIAALIGHKGQSMTWRYVHSADAVLLAAADAVANETAALMGEERPSGVVVEMPKRSE